MPYVHLTYFDRCEIQWGLKHGLAIANIAKTLGRDRSVIYRELARNRRADGKYDALAAQYFYLARKTGPRSKKMDEPRLREHVTKKLRRRWAPLLISDTLKLEYPEDTSMRVSAETIYQFVYEDKQAGGNLYTYLPQGRRQRRKRGSSKGRCGTIKNRVPIEERPSIVARQERVGDWEGDTVIGHNRKRPMATFVDRKMLYATAAFMKDKSAASLNEAALRAFQDIPEELRHTLTVDNGTEFAAHEQLAEQLGLDVYFARPYKSNDRAINENTNGLLRRYFPKGTDFTEISEEDLKYALEELNNKPRPKLGYRTPNEMLAAQRPDAFQI